MEVHSEDQPSRKIAQKEIFRSWRTGANREEDSCAEGMTCTLRVRDDSYAEHLRQPYSGSPGVSSTDYLQTTRLVAVETERHYRQGNVGWVQKECRRCHLFGRSSRQHLEARSVWKKYCLSADLEHSASSPM
jgi:hypothetical protein